jgi:hypothetical protein
MVALAAAAVALVGVGVGCRGWVLLPSWLRQQHVAEVVVVVMAAPATAAGTYWVH